MPNTRSQSNGLPDRPTGWPENDRLARRNARRAAQEERAAEAENEEATAPQGLPPAENAEAANDEGADISPPDPYDRNPPYELWRGIQACGVPSEMKARNIARNLFMNNFARCLKVTKDNIMDTFKSLEKRIENNITVEPYVKNAVLAFHHWVKTCFWLNINPEMVPFPVNDANAILKKSEAHNRFLADASDNKTACKPNAFTKDDKFDEWAKTFEDYLSLIPGATGLPLSYVIRDTEQPQMLLDATDKANFISMASLTGKTFEDDSEKVHICL